MNGDGPFVISRWYPLGDHDHLQLDRVGGGSSDTLRVHAPEDITLYYFAVEPTPTQVRSAFAGLRDLARRTFGK